VINLVRADLYKEVKKKSFLFSIMLIVFVSIFSLIIIAKNIDLKSELNSVYPLFSEEEYKDVNKYGSYLQYKNDYDKYLKVVNIENEVIQKNKLSNSHYLLSYTHNFVFMLGVLIIFISFHSFSYDFQKDSLRYVFMSRHSRRKILFSKVFSNFIISLLFLLILLVTIFITTSFITSENVFFKKVFVNINENIKEVYVVYNYFRISILYLIPFLFISIFSMFLSILFRGNSIGLVISGILYFISLVVSQICFKYGLDFVKYTFLPYIDFTFLSDKVNVSFNNLIYNMNFSYKVSIMFLLLYVFLFLILSSKLLKRDV